MAPNGAGWDQDPHRHRQKLGLDPEPTTQQLAQPTCTYVVQCRLIAWEWPQCFVLSKAVLKGRKLKPSFLRSSQTEFKAKCLFCLPHDEAPATRAPVLTRTRLHTFMGENQALSASFLSLGSYSLCQEIPISRNTGRVLVWPHKLQPVAC